MDYTSYQEKEADFDGLHSLFEALLTRKTDNGRIRNWQEIFVAQGLFHVGETDALTYDRDRWLKEVF